jgi:hypothetical protein
MSENNNEPPKCAEEEQVPLSVATGSPGDSPEQFEANRELALAQAQSRQAVEQVESALAQHNRLYSALAK